MKSLLHFFRLKTGNKASLSVKLITRTWSDFFRKEILTRAQAIAFTAMMAAIPFLALVITIAAYCLPDQSNPNGSGLGEEIIKHLEVLLGTVLPEEAASIFEEQVGRLQSQPPVAVLSFSLFITLWLASNLFASVIDALNRIYDVEETRSYWLLRIIAAFMTITQSVILLASVAAIFAWPILVDWLGLSNNIAWMAAAAKWLIVFLMVLASYSLTFVAGPNIKERFRWFSPGSIFGAIVFLLATYGFRFYVQNLAQYDTMYGSLGGVMIVMFWFWINSLVLLLAAQLNKTFYYKHILTQGENSKINPISSK